MSRDDADWPIADTELAAQGEDLLQDLAREARQQEDEEEPLDEAWEALCRGQLDAEEVELLEQRTPAAQRDSLEAFRPLSEEVRGDLVARLDAQLRADRANEDSAPDAAPEAPTDDSQQPLKFGPRPSARLFRQGLGWLAALLALAFAWRLYTPEDLAPLPEYVLEWSGGADSQRSSSAPRASTPRWLPGTELAIILRPEVAVRGEVYAYPFLLRQEQIQLWPGAPAEIAASGSIRLKLGPRATLDSGDWTILVVLGRSSSAPKIEDVPALLRTSSNASSGANSRVPAAPEWSIWSQSIQVLPPL